MPRNRSATARARKVDARQVVSVFDVLDATQPFPAAVRETMRSKAASDDAVRL